MGALPSTGFPVARGSHMTKKHKQKYCGFLHFLCLGNKGLVLLLLLRIGRLEAALKEC